VPFSGFFGEWTAALYQISASMEKEKWSATGSGKIPAVLSLTLWAERDK
jgi:hypothetical protein